MDMIQQLSLSDIIILIIILILPPIFIYLNKKSFEGWVKIYLKKYKDPNMVLKEIKINGLVFLFVLISLIIIFIWFIYGKINILIFYYMLLFALSYVISYVSVMVYHLNELIK